MRKEIEPQALMRRPETKSPAINSGTVTADTLNLGSGTNAALIFNGGTLKTERAILANGAEL